MAPAQEFPNELRRPTAVTSFAAGLAWMNQASRRHCHFGLKPASHGSAVGTPKGSDFRPGKEGVS